MTAPSNKGRSVGLRKVKIFALNSDGYIAATSATTPYEGITIEGAKLLNITDPEPRPIHHTGDDRLLQTDYLPPTDGMVCELHTAAVDDELDALLSGVEAFTVDTEIDAILWNTNHKGDEPQVALWGFRQSLDLNGMRRWRSYSFAKTHILPRQSNLDENPEDRAYSVIPQKVTKHLWGTSFAEGTEGAVDAQMVRYTTIDKTNIVAWQGDGSTTTFTLPSAYPASATTKMHVYVDGVLTAPTTTLTTSFITTAPTDGANVTLIYEYE